MEGFKEKFGICQTPLKVPSHELMTKIYIGSHAKEMYSSFHFIFVSVLYNTCRAQQVVHSVSPVFTLSNSHQFGQSGQTVYMVHWESWSPGLSPRGCFHLKQSEYYCPWHQLESGFRVVKTYKMRWLPASPQNCGARVESNLPMEQHGSTQCQK